MATQQSAQVYIKNQTDGTALIQLYHNNSSNGTQSNGWIAAPGQTVGPLTVYFLTGWGSYGIPDYWWVRLSVANGSKPGVYNSTGSVVYYGWKECQLQSADAGKTLTFSVDTGNFAINLNSSRCSNPMSYIGPYRQVANVFVVMLENHSFDNMFAMSGIPGINAATSSNSNSYTHNGVKTTYPVGSPAPVSMPTDPGHEFPDVVEQLCGPGATYQSGQPYPTINDSGFAANYATSTTEGPPPPAADIGDVMLCFDTQAQLPVTYQLATEFALCDRWFSSLPGPTWPNRFFVHGASSAGLDHSPTTGEMAEWELPGFGFTYPHGSIFDALTAAKLKWRLYNDSANQFSDDPQNGSVAGGIPQVSSLKGVTLLDVNSLSHFASDLQSPYDFQYTFIEPNYGNVTNGSYAGGSSQHPMDDVYGGEALLKAVYEAIRNSPLWYASLLIVTYDEHGGFYDSSYDTFDPGPAPAPDDGSPATYNQYGFTFEQYGVRVPGIVVSPYIPAGFVDHTVYDHASVPATIERIFGLGSLTNRDAQAKDVRSLLSLPAPRTDCPTTLANPVRSAVARPALSMEEEVAWSQRPLPTTGNLPGFLGAMLKADLELSAATPAEQAAIVENFKQIETRGEAQDYIETVFAKLEHQETPDPHVYRIPGPPPSPAVSESRT
jgi:phospholipase C